MTVRSIAVLVLALLAAGAPPARASGGVQPSPNRLLSGKIQFPRPQAMSVQTSAGDGTRLTVSLGFDGTCKGGGLGEVWAAYVPATPTVRVRNGQFTERLTGTSKNFG